MSDDQKTEDFNKLAECEKKRDEYLSGWQRERADFQNYKKEEFKRMQEVRSVLTAALVEEFLPVLDSFDIAFDFLPSDPATQKWAKGMEQVRFQLLDILKRNGVEVIHVETGKTVFDPVQHEAMEEVASDKPEGTVIEVLQKGYSLNGKVIRPVRVRVAKAGSKN